VVGHRLGQHGLAAAWILKTNLSFCPGGVAKRTSHSP
jgi:hypothetical protein